MSARPQVLIVDDDPVLVRVAKSLLESHGYRASAVGTGIDAVGVVAGGFSGVVILDVRLPDMDGPEVFRSIRRTAPDCPVIFLTSYGSTDLAVDAIRDGAFEFIEKSLIYERLAGTVDMAFASMRESSRADGAAFDGTAYGIVTHAREMREVFQSLRNAVDSNVPVLVHGESGTGKELVARALHNSGPRAGEPFVAINCAGIPETLLEAELFGHERGAFTGAVSRKPGKFEAARGGTILLDEIGEMAPVLQAKLLRVLQEGEFQRLGGNETVRTDARVVSATNRNLEDEVARGTFRADLYYRLAVYTIHIPPLRERSGDVTLLVTWFTERFARREGKRITDVDPRAMELLRSHTYPGNVRELENIISYAVVSTRDSRITIADLPPAFLAAASQRRRMADEPVPAARTAALVVPAPSDGKAEPEDEAFPTLRDVEKQHIERAMVRARGNKSVAASLLGISRMTLYRKIRELEGDGDQ